MSAEIPRVAIILLGVSNISGGGGAERQWLNFFKLSQKTKGKVNLFLITDQASYKYFQELNLLKDKTNVLIVKRFSNRFKHTLENLYFHWLLLKNRLNIIHVVCYYPYYHVPLLKYLNNVKLFPTPLISLNIEDCTIAYNYHSPDSKARKQYHELFNQIKLDGIFTWYESFKHFVEEKKVLKFETPVRTAQFCFTDLSKFKPAKKNNDIVFAGRLTFQKRPELFLYAAHYLIKNYSSIVSDWNFYIFGKGEMHEELTNYIVSHKLHSQIKLNETDDMSLILSKSKLVVSTQDYENFTSLSVLEAMACGNAIIARDLGQTSLFVKNNINGFLVQNDDPENIAEKIIKYIQSEEHHAAMAEASITIASTIHTFDNFRSQMEDYWLSLKN